MRKAEINPVLPGHEARDRRLLVERRCGIFIDGSRHRLLTAGVMAEATV